MRRRTANRRVGIHKHTPPSQAFRYRGLIPLRAQVIIHRFLRPDSSPPTVTTFCFSRQRHASRLGFRYHVETNLRRSVSAYDDFSHTTCTMADKEFTYSDVSEHNTKKDLYIVVHDKVYDASSFVDEHPYVRSRPPRIRLARLARACYRSGTPTRPSAVPAVAVTRCTRALTAVQRRRGGSP